MRFYPDHIPDWFSNLLPKYVWHGDRNKRTVYLTFDDGPTPMITDFVVEQLAIHDFKATFFLIGDRAQRFPAVKQRLIDAGHHLGNHTHHHLNAWKVDTKEYLDNIAFAKANTSSSLFRPPYGKITPTISKNLRANGYRIILWDVLSGDFDAKRSPYSCLQALKKHTKNGSVVVFHDSEKAFPILKVILPQYLEWLIENGYKSALF